MNNRARNEIIKTEWEIAADAYLRSTAAKTATGTLTQHYLAGLSPPPTLAERKLITKNMRVVYGRIYFNGQ